MRIINMAPGLSFPAPWQDLIDVLEPGLFLSQGKWSDDGAHVDDAKLIEELAGTPPDTHIMLNVEVSEYLYPESRLLDVTRHPVESTQLRQALSAVMDDLPWEYSFYMTLRTVTRAYNKSNDYDARRIAAGQALDEAIEVKDWIGKGLPCVSAYWIDGTGADVKVWQWRRWIYVTGKEIADCRYYAKREPVVVIAPRIGGGNPATPLIDNELFTRQLQWLWRQDVTVIFWASQADTDIPTGQIGSLWWYAQ